VQTIDLDVHLGEDGGVCYVDVNERHAFVCTPGALHVYARDRDAAKVLDVPRSWSFNSVPSAVVEPGNSFISVLSLHPGNDDGVHPNFRAAHVSRDGRDLVILATRGRVIFIRDFERICRGEVSLAPAGQVLRLSMSDKCFYLAFEHGRVCVATVNGLYIVNMDRRRSIDSAKVVLVRPYFDLYPRTYQAITCMQLTNRRVYFTWEDARRRDDVPLYKEGGNALGLSSYGTLSTDEPSHEAWPWLNDIQFDPRWGISLGCIDFSLMPES